jgi:ubiquinone/menaquinone biosynthesis C-methylase UbiE
MTRDAGDAVDGSPALSLQSTWAEAEARAAGLIRSRTGGTLDQHLRSKLTDAPGMRALALGTSAAALAVKLAGEATDARVVCVETTIDSLDASRQRASALGIDAQFIAGDLNAVELEPAAFDLVFSHATLHRITAMPALIDQIKRALRRDGMFVAVEVVAREDYFMWPATRAVARALWKTMPVKFRLNHTAYAVPLIDDEIWEPRGAPDYATDGPAQSILPVLEQSFVTEHFVPYFSLCRRFFDSMYGPNYNLGAPLDRAVFDWVWQLDVHHLATGHLRPENIFAIYRAD